MKTQIKFPFSYGDLSIEKEALENLTLIKKTVKISTTYVFKKANKFIV